MTRREVRELISRHPQLQNDPKLRRRVLEHLGVLTWHVSREWGGTVRVLS